MPELPEVEVLVRHLAPVLKGRSIRAVDVRRAKSVAPTKPDALARALTGARFLGVRRRGKFLLFDLQPPRTRDPLLLVGHLGMTGRMYVRKKGAPLPKHAAVVLNLERQQDFIFEDTRYFGRLTLDGGSIPRLGPEPLGDAFTTGYFSAQLKRSAQAIKVKLLDQSLVAGVGNIYASEALFRAGISPRRASRRLTSGQVATLHRTIREALAEAIAFGSTVPLDWLGTYDSDGLFYYGSADDAAGYEERLLVYDRDGEPCTVCGLPIKRIVQAARSTFFCSKCQK